MNITHKIKELRKAKGYTLEILAEKTGFTKGYLSKIERSQKVPPFATVHIIANALGIQISDILETGGEYEETKNIVIIKNAIEQRPESSHGSPYSFIPLLKEYDRRYMCPFIAEIQKGATQPITHDSEEFVYVISGSFELQYEGKKYSLCANDCFYLDSRISHCFFNEQEEPALLLTVFFNYRRF